MWAFIFSATIWVALVGGSRPYGPGSSYQPAYPSYEYKLPVNYEFNYGVNDYYTGQNFKHRENRQGVKTSGSYEVALPDGRIQIVTYVADENGYVADVSYRGQVHNDDGKYLTAKLYESQPVKEPPTNYPPPGTTQPVLNYKTKPVQVSTPPVSEPVSTSIRSESSLPPRYYPSPDRSYKSPQQPSYKPHSSYQGYLQPQPYRKASYLSTNTDYASNKYDGPLFRSVVKYPPSPKYAETVQEEVIVKPVAPVTEQLPVVEDAAVDPVTDVTSRLDDVIPIKEVEDETTNLPVISLESFTETIAASADEPVYIENNEATTETMSDAKAEVVTMAPFSTEVPATTITVQEDAASITEGSVIVEATTVELESKNEVPVEATTTTPAPSTTETARPKYSRRPFKSKPTLHPILASIYSNNQVPATPSPTSDLPSSYLSRYGNQPRSFAPKKNRFSSQKKSE